MHLSTLDGVVWDLSATPFGSDENGYPVEETSYAGERAYAGGRGYQERFGTAVVGPRVDTAAELGLYRKGDRMWGTLPLLADGAGHDGTGFHATGKTVSGHPLRVPVTVQGPAAGAGLKSLVVSASYDDGSTWKVLPVQDGAVTTQNPPPGGHVSLRGTVVDTEGNRSEATVLRAYLTD
ncbi:hypothetical protein [Streptomyces sp. NPDC054961]